VPPGELCAFSQSLQRSQSQFLVHAVRPDFERAHRLRGGIGVGMQP